MINNNVTHKVNTAASQDLNSTAHGDSMREKIFSGSSRRSSLDSLINVSSLYYTQRNKEAPKTVKSGIKNTVSNAISLLDTLSNKSPSHLSKIKQNEEKMKNLTSAVCSGVMEKYRTASTVNESTITSIIPAAIKEVKIAIRKYKPTHYQSATLSGLVASIAMTDSEGHYDDIIRLSASYASKTLRNLPDSDKTPYIYGLIAGFNSFITLGSGSECKNNINKAVEAAHGCENDAKEAYSDVYKAMEQYHELGKNNYRSFI